MRFLTLLVLIYTLMIVESYAQQCVVNTFDANGNPVQMPTPCARPADPVGEFLGGVVGGMLGAGLWARPGWGGYHGGDRHGPRHHWQGAGDWHPGGPPVGHGVGGHLR